MGDKGSSFAVDDSPVISTASARLSKTAPFLRSNLVNHVKGLVDELEASQAVTAMVEKEAERQKALVLAGKKSKKNALTEVTRLLGGVAVVRMCEAKLLSNASVVSRQITRATTKLCQTRGMISMQSKGLARIAQLKTSKKRLENNVTFYEVSKESLKNELANGDNGKYAVWSAV